MFVAEIMSPDVTTCRPQDSLQEAAAKMWDRDIGCLPVVDLDRRVIGVVTDRDACMAAYTQGRPLEKIWVESAMAYRVHCCLPSEPIEKAETVMKTYRVRRIPVVDDEGHIVGMLTMNDIVRESAREQKKNEQDVPSGDVVSTLAAICEPRRARAAAALPV